MLEVEGLGKSYPTPRGPLAVLEAVSFTLRPGEALVVTGPSGSGKSTLLHLLGTLDTPSAGRLRLDGRDPFALPEPELARFRNRSLGFVFQDHGLLPQLEVLENVLLPALACPPAPPELPLRARALLERVGLSDRLTHRPAELSGGEKQRVALARALLLEPRLLLADEPTGNLDRSSAGRIVELLLELRGERMLVVVTHAPELFAGLPRARLDQGRLESL